MLKIEIAEEIDRASYIWDNSVRLTFKEFFDLKDRDLQEYIYLHCNSHLTQISYRNVDNDEKVGYYRFTDSVKMNRQGKFYMKSTLDEWIVYRRATKKVSLGRSFTNVWPRMLKDYFYQSDTIEALNMKVTPTLCKKIIEGSINTLGDFIKYVRSYVLKRKDVSIETVYRFMMMKRLHYLHNIINPDDIKSMEEIEIQLPSAVVMSSHFRFRLEDIKQAQNEYGKWVGKQSEKLAAFKEQRAFTAGYNVSTKFATKETVSDPELDEL